MTVVILGNRCNRVQYDDIKEIVERDKDILLLTSSGRVITAEKLAISTMFVDMK